MVDSVGLEADVGPMTRHGARSICLLRGICEHRGQSMRFGREGASLCSRTRNRAARVELRRAKHGGRFRGTHMCLTRCWEQRDATWCEKVRVGERCKMDQREARGGAGWRGMRGRGVKRGGGTAPRGVGRNETVWDGTVRERAASRILRAALMPTLPQLKSASAAASWKRLLACKLGGWGGEEQMCASEEGMCASWGSLLYGRCASAACPLHVSCM